MSLRRIMLSAVGVLCLSITVRAGPVTTFTDIDAFLEAAGDVREIDFETLPDGTPSVRGTLITPEFNYTDQGVTFSSPYPVLVITAPIEGSGFPLSALFEGGSGRNWIIADFVPSALAVGIVFPGTTTLSTFDADEQLIVGVSGGGSGAGWFLGIVSDVPIARVIGDRGGLSGEAWESFLFTPVPEPSTIVLVVIGAASVMRRRRGASTH